MPPSGYTVDQSSSVVDFLGSCASSLEKEGIQKNLTPLEALRSECANINTILQASKSEHVADAVLSLTHCFYSNLITQKPENYEELRIMVLTTLENTEDEILAIHVPEM